MKKRKTEREKFIEAQSRRDRLRAAGITPPPITIRVTMNAKSARDFLGGDSVIARSAPDGN